MVARAMSWGTGTRTTPVRALKTRAFCDSQNLEEQFGEQSAIFEQIVILFAMLDAERQTALLEILKERASAV